MLLNILPKLNFYKELIYDDLCKFAGDFIFHTRFDKYGIYNEEQLNVLH